MSNVIAQKIFHILFWQLFPTNEWTTSVLDRIHFSFIANLLKFSELARPHSTWDIFCLLRLHTCLSISVFSSISFFNNATVNSTVTVNRRTVKSDKTHKTGALILKWKYFFTDHMVLCLQVSSVTNIDLDSWNNN